MSDQDNSIFEQGDHSATTSSQNVSVDTSNTPDEASAILAQIQAEDGRQKYGDVPSALKGLQHSQTHISRLEQELSQLREDLAKRKGAEELLDQIKNTGTGTATTDSPKLDVDSISNLVETVLTKREILTIARSNQMQVVNTMKEVFGDKAPEVYQKAAEEYGLSVADFNKLASSSPKTILRLVGIGDKQPTAPKLSSSVNTAALTAPATQGSAKIKGTSTRDVVSAWRAAGESIKNK